MKRPGTAYTGCGLAALVCLLVLALAPVALAAPAEPSPQPAPSPTRPDGGPSAPAPAPGPTPAPGPPETPVPEEPTPDGKDTKGGEVSPAPREPSPGATPPACEADGRECTPAKGVGFGDLIDIPGMVTDAVTGFLGMVVDQVMKPLRSLLSATYLTTPDVTQHADLRHLWKSSMATAVGVYVLFVMVGGLTVMGYETVQTRFAVKQIAPRLVIGLIAAASSLTLMGKGIALANALSASIMGSDLSDAGQGLVEKSLPFMAFGVKGLAVYLILLALVGAALMLGVLMGYIVRVAFIAILAVAAPLALACHAHPLTDPVARLWWRALGACLTIQVAQSLTFIVALKLFFAPGSTLLGLPKPNQLGTTLAGIALFWVLFKIPGWCMRFIFRSTVLTTPHSPAPVRMARNTAMLMLLRRTVPAAANSGGRRRPGPGGTPPGNGTGGPPGPSHPGPRPTPPRPGPASNPGPPRPVGTPGPTNPPPTPRSPGGFGGGHPPGPGTTGGTPGGLPGTNGTNSTVKTSGIANAGGTPGVSHTPRAIGAPSPNAIPSGVRSPGSPSSSRLHHPGSGQVSGRGRRPGTPTGSRSVPHPPPGQPRTHRTATPSHGAPSAASRPGDPSSRLKTPTTQGNPAQAAAASAASRHGYPTSTPARTTSAHRAAQPPRATPPRHATTTSARRPSPPSSAPRPARSMRLRLPLEPPRSRRTEGP